MASDVRERVVVGAGAAVLRERMDNTVKTSDDIKELTGLELPEGPFNTLAGFIISQLGRIPQVGDSVEALDHRFTVTEMDGRRVARIRITPIDGQVDADEGRKGVSPTQATPP